MGGQSQENSLGAEKVMGCSPRNQMGFEAVLERRERLGGTEAKERVFLIGKSGCAAPRVASSSSVC